MNVKKITLSLPCYVNHFYPEVGKASLALLKKLGYEVNIPLDQRCCGQPIANSGYEHIAKESYEAFVNTFKGNETIVMPSGSCAMHVKKHYDTIPQTEDVIQVRSNLQDLSQYIYQHHLEDLPNISFPYKIAVHTGCHSLRGMGFGETTEIHCSPNNHLASLLEKVKGTEVINLNRKDECCGFGGTFAITEEATSIAMGNDKLRDAIDKGIGYIVSNDMSCLMHLDGIIKKQKLPIKVKHILEILANKNK